ncbi:MAG: hypothetical protein ACK526_01295 [Planctomyces sp.]
MLRGLRIVTLLGTVVLAQLTVAGGSAQAQYGGVFPPFTPAFWGLGGVYGYYPYSAWNAGAPALTNTSYYAPWWGAGVYGDQYAASYAPTTGGCCNTGCSTGCSGNCGTDCSAGGCAPSSTGESLKPKVDTNFDERRRDDRSRDVLDEPASDRRNDRRNSDPLDEPTDTFRRSPDNGRSKPRDTEDTGSDRDSGSRGIRDNSRDEERQPLDGLGSDDDTFPSPSTNGSRATNKPPMSDPLKLEGDAPDTSNEEGTPDPVEKPAEERELKPQDELGTPATEKDFLSPVDEDEPKKTEDEPKKVNNDQPNVTKRSGSRTPIVASGLREVLRPERLAGRRESTSDVRHTRSDVRRSDSSTERRPVRWISLPSKSSTKTQL